jgi:hypothetical protein
LIVTIVPAVDIFDRRGQLSRISGVIKRRNRNGVEFAPHRLLIALREGANAASLALSTAATLSARFPYVTPPGLLMRDAKIHEYDNTLKQTAALQLIDGGFWDNSGVATATEIVRQLRTSDQTKELVKSVDFHLVSFGHARSALQKSGARDAQSEFVTPMATFEAVRQARRFSVRDATGFAAVHVIELFDHAFQAPLTWTLSERVRRKIEARSGGGVEPTLCCALSVPRVFGSILPEIVVDLGEVGSKLASINDSYLRFVAPNKQRFEEIVRLVSDETIPTEAAPK